MDTECPVFSVWNTEFPYGHVSVVCHQGDSIK